MAASNSPGRKKRQRQGGGLFFTSLKMVHWRNFQGETEINFAPRVFLLGPNASGKSNVLDALRFLRDTADKGLQAAIGSRGGMGAVRSLHARRPPGFTLAVTVGDKAQPVQWRYSLQVRNHPQKHVPEVVAEEVIDVSGRKLLRRPTRDDKNDPDRLRQTHLEQTAANQRFRPLTEFLTSIRYLHVVPQLMRDPERSAGRRNDPFGADFLEAIATTPQPAGLSWRARTCLWSEKLFSDTSGTAPPPATPISLTAIWSRRRRRLEKVCRGGDGRWPWFTSSVIKS